MRAVLDTHVFISGLLFPHGIPGRVTEAWRAGAFSLVLSESILEEIARVLAYPMINRRLGWDRTTLERYVSLMRFEAELIDIRVTAMPVPREPSDNPILATLLASSADVLVTGDDELLVLADRYSIVSPGRFAERLG